MLVSSRRQEIETPPTSRSKRLKIIRAVLTSEGTHGGIGHALSQMVALLPPENVLKPQLALLAPLAAYATTYRYPTSSRVPRAPSEVELGPHLENLERVLLQASQQFGVDLEAPGAPARTPLPPR